MIGNGSSFKKLIIFICVILLGFDVSALFAQTEQTSTTATAPTASASQTQTAPVQQSQPAPKPPSSQRMTPTEIAEQQKLAGEKLRKQRQAQSAAENATDTAQPTAEQSSSSSDDASYTTNPAVRAAAQQAAFQQTAAEAFPLKPHQIIQLHHMYDQTQEAAAVSPKVPPKPTSTSLFVSLSPGATPPAIRLSEGFVSSLVFLDSTGAPWPIVSYDLGNPKAFDIQWDKKGNTLMIQATSAYTYGNLAVTLKGQSTPVVLTLIPGQKVVDYRVDLRVQGVGPNATALPASSGLPGKADSNLLGILDGIPPSGSKLLVTKGAECKAWLYQGRLYVRTHLTVLSPGWLSSMTSPDGTKAYEMPRTPVILVSDHGKIVEVRIKGV